MGNVCSQILALSSKFWCVYVSFLLFILLIYTYTMYIQYVKLILSRLTKINTFYYYVSHTKILTS